MMVRRVSAWCGAGLLAALFTSAPARAEVIDQFQDWTLQCFDAPDGEECIVTQVVLRDGNQVLGVGVDWVSAEDRARIIFNLPPQAIEGTRMALTIDEGETRYLPIDNCGEGRCQLRAVAEDALIAEMKRGERAVVTFLLPPEERLDVPVSLLGFTAGYEAMRARSQG